MRCVEQSYPAFKIDECRARLKVSEAFVEPITIKDVIYAISISQTYREQTKYSCGYSKYVIHCEPFLTLDMKSGMAIKLASLMTGEERWFLLAEVRSWQGVKEKYRPKFKK